MPYEIKLEQFSGPLEKLLQLIEEEQLPISEVSMAKVTDSFLRYLEQFKSGGDEGKFVVDLRILADFISVASRLIFLKSKQLLPGLALTDDEEGEIRDLEERLKRYQALKPALRHINALWKENHRSYSRPYFLGRGRGGAAAGMAPGQTFFYPGGTLNKTAMQGALEKIFETIKTYELETETIKEKIITLEEKIEEVLGRIRGGGDMAFKSLSNEKSRSEMIVIFLAILHLAREQLVFLEQMDNFSDIMVRKPNGEKLGVKYKTT